jgi:hypothetical protein
LQAKCATAAVVAALLLGVLVGAAATHAPMETPTTVLAIDQSPTIITEQSALTVSLKVADSTNIQQVYFTFCQLTSSVCYLPVTMAPIGANWFQGTTKPMTGYNGMTVGVRAGYNITITYNDNTTQSEPSMPNQFGNLTIAQSITGEYLFEMTVSNQTYGLSGHVYSSATGAGIAGANVTLTPGKGMTALTSGAGAYSFAGLFNGTYTISVTKAGYRSSNATMSIAGRALVKDITLSNASSPSDHNGKGANQTSEGFFSTTAGMGALAIVVVVVVLVALVAFSMSRRRKGGGQPPTKDGPETPSSPPQKAN